ncbi:hypothetical protein E4Z66_00115 [Aliishimia ponticola]|uniref:Thioredoxin family protein n=2 Tax=Aliishimia ponticola TaxID=2499833 RepID=A0A4S4NSE6_9RHOB|nr:hypothetical protein [Aliishimia ponticola]THH39160.1 hypothetical protein E4Z66_00115 [Aliishimia ponticola]
MATSVGSIARADTFLLMAEQIGCHYCKRWDAEISAIYPKTNEGRTAPLRRYDIHDGTPDGIALARSVRFTPTFVLVKDGVERGRIEGYPGEDFFWGLLGLMFERAQIDPATSG